MSLLWNPKSLKQEGGKIEENHLKETNSEIENEPQDSVNFKYKAKTKRFSC